MSTSTKVAKPTQGNVRTGPPVIFNDSFAEPGAEKQYGEATEQREDAALDFMPDDMTRDISKRMHYAAWRVNAATNKREAARWRGRYLDCRNRIVLGNRKLTYRAVQKWGVPPQMAEDMAGDCQLVLIHAVATFNPWLGIRFSTYAFTCLMRALSRLSQRQAADQMSRSLPLDALSQSEPSFTNPEEIFEPRLAWLGKYFQDEATLLTPREKFVLTRRFHLNDDSSANETLEEVGRELGLSKERVRQVQMSALGKLREALLQGPPES